MSLGYVFGLLFCNLVYLVMLDINMVVKYSSVTPSGNKDAVVIASKVEKLVMLLALSIRSVLFPIGTHSVPVPTGLITKQ